MKKHPSNIHNSVDILCWPLPQTYAFHLFAANPHRTNTAKARSSAFPALIQNDVGNRALWVANGLGAEGELRVEVEVTQLSVGQWGVADPASDDFF